jgi:hypothetical protein
VSWFNLALGLNCNLRNLIRIFVTLRCYISPFLNFFFAPYNLELLIKSTKWPRKQTHMTSTHLPYVPLHITFTHKYTRVSVFMVVCVWNLELLIKSIKWSQKQTQMTSTQPPCQNPLVIHCSIKIMLSLCMWRSILPSHTNALVRVCPSCGGMCAFVHW